MTTLKRISPLSLGKVSAIIYAIFGLIAGIFITIFFLVGISVAKPESAFFLPVLGAASIIILPIFYGIIGFVAGVVGAFIYNLIARWIGGIEVTLK